MWELDHKEGWAPQNWCFRTAVLEKTLESPLDWKEIKPVKPKWNQPWIFTGRTDAEASVLWLPEVKSQLIEKDPDTGKDRRQRRWRWQRTRWLDGITNSEQVLGYSEGQGSLVCYAESDTTKWLNNSTYITQRKWLLKHIWVVCSPPS